MKENSGYCYKGSTEFVIKNGILKGNEEPCFTELENLGECLLQNLKAAPEFIGQIDGKTGEETNFGKIMERSVKCAMWLKQQNVQPGDILGICSYNQIDMCVPFFATLYIGAVMNPWWNEEITKEMASYFLTLSRPKILFADEDSANLIQELAKEMDMPLKVIVFGNLPGFQSLDEILASQDSKMVAEFQCTNLCGPADSAVLLYTSGSTGLPKGVVLSHKSMLGMVQNYIDLGKPDGTTIPLIYAPLAWITCILTILRAVVTRETIILHPEFSEETTFQLIEKYKVNWLLLAPSYVISLQKSPARTKYDLSSLKYLYMTGSVVKEEIYESLTVDFPHTTIRQLYGMTETGVITRQRSGHRKPGSSGTVLKNMQVKVIDTESGLILGPNEIGEAWAKFPFMMTCYYKNPKATSETIDSEGWLHTGDLVYYDEEGHLFITDRIKDMIKYRAHHVSPGMIEQLLQGHPAVFEAGVVGIPNEIDDEHPMAFVVKSPNAKVTKDELLKLVTDKLPDYMKLRGGLHFMNELPHTSSGKISRRHLRKIAQTVDKAV